MIDDSILEDGEVAVAVVGGFLLLVVGLGLDVLVLDLDDVLLVLVDDGEEFAFDLGEVLSGLVLVEEVGLLLDDEV